jgi:hypothetical protein
MPFKDTTVLLETGDTNINTKPKRNTRLIWKILLIISLMITGFVIGYGIKSYQDLENSVHIISDSNPNSVINDEVDTSVSQTDIKILQYALILENLESAFYSEGMTNFTVGNFTNAGFNQTVYYNFANIASHEKTHVEALSNAIKAAGQTPYPACTYNFTYTDIDTFIALARALERTGVSAYDGVIHGIAAGFIKSCTFELPVKPYPTFVINPSSGAIGTNFTLSSSSNVNTTINTNSTTIKYCAFLFGMNTTWTPVYNQTCLVPGNVSGDSYVFLTSDNSTQLVLDSQGSIVAGPVIFSIV